MMFVDASAIVAILTGEAGYERLADRIIRCEAPMTSAIAIYEAVLAIGRKTSSLQRAEKAVFDFLRLSSIEIVAISEPEARSALDAFARFGKGQGHPAQLNMGDCFSYACGKTHGVPLLFVGNDFSRTDIPSALP